jgi:hypothetical protein
VSETGPLPFREGAADGASFGAAAGFLQHTLEELERSCRPQKFPAEEASSPIAL